MSDARAQRLRTIMSILRSEALGSQEEVTNRLAELGFAVTQATVSRDLEQLGAVKVKSGGALRYALPDQMAQSDWSGERLARILADWVISMEAAGNLLVMRTPPGSAHLVGAAIDGARLSEVAGTLSGDDTLFLAVRNGFGPEQLLARFRSLCGPEPKTD